ncbi:MAG: hypothetical protein V4713_03610 [Pseudomonadota bacterium]
MPKKKYEYKADDEDAQRVARQSVLYATVKGVAGKDPLETTTDLMCVCLRLLAESYPGDLSDKAKVQINENYGNATEALMKERAMSPTGVKVALVLCEQLGRIALDYSPDSLFKKDMEKDIAAKETVGSYGAALQDAYKHALAQGLSAFGASTTMVLTGTALGGMNGLGTQRLARPLIDALLLSFDFEKKEPPVEGSREYKVAVDQAISQVAKQLGISKAAAGKYAAYVEQQIRDGKL